MSSGQEQLCIWYLNPIFYAPQSLLFHCFGHIETSELPHSQFNSVYERESDCLSICGELISTSKSVPHLLGMLPLGPAVKIKFEVTVFFRGEKQAPIFFKRNDYKLLIFLIARHVSRITVQLRALSWQVRDGTGSQKVVCCSREARKQISSWAWCGPWTSRDLLATHMKSCFQAEKPLTCLHGSSKRCQGPAIVQLCWLYL